MVHMLLTVFGLLSFGGPVFGSEQPIKEIVLHVKFPMPGAGALVYSSVKNSRVCQYFGIASDANEPFVPLAGYNDKPDETYQDEIYNKFEEIEAIPYRCLLDIHNKKFKKKDEEIIFPVRLDDKYRVKLVMFDNLLSQYDSNALLRNFREKPGFILGDEKELIERGLITADGNHGPNAMEFIKPTLSTQIKSFSYFSYFKKPLLFLGSLAAVFLIYKKLYV